MEDRIRALEGQLTGLNANIKLLTWLGGLAGLALAAWLGATSIFMIPAQVADLLAKNGLDEAKQTLSELVAETTALRDDATANATSISSLLAEIQSDGVQLYQCPKLDDALEPRSGFIAVGCLGQISSIDTCTNTKYGPAHTVTKCEPIGLYARLPE